MREKWKKIERKTSKPELRGVRCLVRVAGSQRGRVLGREGAEGNQGAKSGQRWRSREARERRREARTRGSHPAAKSPLAPARPAAAQGETGATAGETESVPSPRCRARAGGEGDRGCTEPELEKREGKASASREETPVLSAGRAPRPGAREAADTGGLLVPGAGRS